MSQDVRQPGQRETQRDQVQPADADAERGEDPAHNGGDPQNKVETHAEVVTRMAGLPNAAIPHVRVRGFCDACQGLGRLGVRHIDVELTAGERAVADVLHIRRDTLNLVANAVRLQVEARLAEIGTGSGCEANGSRMFQLGRLEVIETDMWKAVGITADEPAAAGY